MESNTQLAARLLTAYLREAGYQVAPIDWTTHGFKARVTVNGVYAGTLLTAYERMRNGTLLERLPAAREVQ